MNVFRFLRKICLVLLPVAVYFVIFIIFEPYNYFGLKHNRYVGDSAIARVREYNARPTDVIILGDSRMAHFDMELVEDCVGRPVKNLAFGGAAFNESMDLLEYAFRQNPDLDTVYFGVSFYTLNQGYYKDRMSRIKTIAENPLAYMFNFNYNVEMLNEIRYFLKGEKNVAEENIGSWGDEDFFYPDGTRRKYRKNLEEYALGSIYPVCEDYVYDKEDADRYFELCDALSEKGVTVYTVLPPMDDSIKDLVVDSLGIDKSLTEFINRAALHSTVLNYEYGGRVHFPRERFYDGFHMDGEKGLPDFTRMLFER